MKLNQGMIDLIAQCILDGLPYKHTAAIVGINESTFYDWRKKGDRSKDENCLYSKFSKTIKESEAENIRGRLKNIQQAGTDGKWQADAWLLERRYPNEFGLKQPDVEDENSISKKMADVLTQLEKNAKE